MDDIIKLLVFCMVASTIGVFGGCVMVAAISFGIIGWLLTPFVPLLVILSVLLSLRHALNKGWLN